MKGKKCVLGLSVLGLLFTNGIHAQNSLEIDLSADLVSSYVWRGIKTAGASVQPSLSAEYKGFALEAWASTDIASEGTKEVDFTASYSYKGFQIALTDYWWDGEGAYRYFSHPYCGDGHMLEASIGYQISESFPLSIAWNTFFLGEGNKKADGDNSYSTYIELAYPFSVKDVDLHVSTGFTPWESAIYGTHEFQFISIELGASKEIKINDRFSLPIFGNVIFNPAMEDVHFVFGITIK